MSKNPPPSATTAGFNFSNKKPDGDEKERLVCNGCGFIHYVNPKIVVGVVTGTGNKILLCKRAIEPRAGFWTLPAGFMEEAETTEQGALREAREEANADLEILSLLAVYNIPRISQVQLFYKARMRTPHFSPGPESMEVGLFEWDEIPWDEIAFPSAKWALRHYYEVRNVEIYVPFSNPPGENGNF